VLTSASVAVRSLWASASKQPDTANVVTMLHEHCSLVRFSLTSFALHVLLLLLMLPTDRHPV
jgi:hypothetical protein